jgi:hypothetical protein
VMGNRRYVRFEYRSVTQPCWYHSVGSSRANEIVVEHSSSYCDIYWYVDMF